jgi:hypothetical protein
VRSSIDASLPEVLSEIERELKSAPPSADAVAAIQRQLAEFGAAASAETVIESYYGCRLTERLRRRFEIPLAALPVTINTSHRAVRRVCVMPGEHLHDEVRKDAWVDGWRRLRQHTGVDMYVRTERRDRSLRHADLYLIASGQIISLEYKYVGPKGLKNLEACAGQMRPYRNAHAATRLVIYSGTPTGPVRGLDTLTGLLPADVPLVVYGPPVVAAGKPDRHSGH